jgi:hypothetical protein
MMVPETLLDIQMVLLNTSADSTDLLMHRNDINLNRL